MQTISLVDFETASPWIAQLLMSAAETRETVAAFTDEELVALDGVDEEQVAPALWLDTQPHDRRAFAAAVAMRGLVARGLVARLDEHQEDGRVVLSMPDEVLAVLAMRRTASAILIAERQTNAGKHARVVYVHGEHGVLEEDVNAGGLHAFSVCPEAMALDDLTGWCDPQAVVEDADGDSETVALADYAQGGAAPASLADALAVTVVAAVLPAAEPGGEPRQDRMTVYCFADHVKVLHRATTDADLLVIRRVGRSSLRAALERLCGARA